MELKLQWMHALQKVFPDEMPDCTPYTCASALRGELFHLQLGFCLSKASSDRFKVEITSPLKEQIKVFDVRCVPVMMPVYPWSDDYQLRTTPGLYPDLLMPSNGIVSTATDQWRSLWFEVEIPENCPAGEYPIQVTLTHYDHPECNGSATFSLKVIPAVLPKQTLKHTEWFHSDCLAEYYRFEVFSDAYWETVENYMKQAVRYGVNMILTPIFTPPLDTEVGKERPTVQLVDVEKTGNTYRFGFERLEKFIRIAQNAGIEYFEFAHLFTQWGAEHAVKVIATVDGVKRRIFGWETDATGAEYSTFLNTFLPQLKAFMRSLGLADRCFFHISDEPSEAQEASYRAARGTVSEVLSDCAVIDALSHYQFYENGLVQIPIAANSVVDEFLEKGVERRWTYYCCANVDRVSNRMIAMPSERNRILGMQLFRFQMEGFLHWGFNFWFNRLSQKLINPFVCTDAEDAFPSGDAFLVYPGPDGQPLASIHQMVFADGLQDLRALQLLSSLSDFSETAAFIDEYFGKDFNFSNYPHDAQLLLSVREAVNRKIETLLA